MITIILNTKLEEQVKSMAQEMDISVDEIVNDILSKYFCNNISNHEPNLNRDITEKLLSANIAAKLAREWIDIHLQDLQIDWELSQEKKFGVL
jgi:hypothetical protein